MLLDMLHCFLRSLFFFKERMYFSLRTAWICLWKLYVVWEGDVGLYKQNEVVFVKIGLVLGYGLEGKDVDDKSWFVLKDSLSG